VDQNPTKIITLSDLTMSHSTLSLIVASDVAR